MKNAEDVRSDDTKYLLRSKNNAERLFKSIREAERGEGEVMTVGELRKSTGLDEES